MIIFIRTFSHDNAAFLINNRTDFLYFKPFFVSITNPICLNIENVMRIF